MSIKHIEHTEFITEPVLNPSKVVITEKLDGFNLLFGIDRFGDLFTSRENKGGHRFYDETDYPINGANNAFKSAHAALMTVGNVISEVLSFGDVVQCEILHGPQPNAIPYGDDYIVFLKDNRNGELIQELNERLRYTTIEVTTSHISSLDGITLSIRPQTVQWRFTTVPVLSSSLFQTNESKRLAQKCHMWLHEPSPVTNLTNLQLLRTNLNKIPVTERQQVKLAREQARLTYDQYCLQIKQCYNKTLSSMTSALKQSTVDDESLLDIGLEGVVVDISTSNGTTTTKIVDRNKFTQVNQFNHMISNWINRTSRGSSATNLIDCGIESDILGRFWLEVFNYVEPDFRKRTINSTLRMIHAASVPLSSACSRSHHQTISRIAANSLQELEVFRRWYLQTWNLIEDYIAGNRVKIVPSFHQRNLLSLAEARKTLKMFENLSQGT